MRGAAASRTFVRLRYVVLVAWTLLAVWIGLALPPIPSGGGASLSSLIPPNSPAVQAERVSAKRFDFPLLSRTVVVVRNPHGLSADRQVQLTALAVRLSLHRVAGFRTIAGALPIANALGLLPFARERGTSEILELFFRSSVSVAERTRTAERLIRRVIGHRRGEYEGVTGTAPARSQETSILSGRLIWVELATILLVAIVLAIHFRAVGAALMTIGTIAVAYVIADRLAAQAAKIVGASIPGAIEPVLVVLVFGVATDYSVFFLSRYRALLAAGSSRRAAAAEVTRTIAPPVAVAGLTVAAGTAGLLAATLRAVRGLAPALAVAVIVTMAVAVTLVPAILAVGGRALFWPHEPRSATASLSSASAAAEEPSKGTRGWRILGARGRRWAIDFATGRPVLTIALVLAVTLVAGSGLLRIRLGDEIVKGLPSANPVHRADTELAAGFVAGMLSPSVLVLTGHHLGGDLGGLARLQSLLGHRPRVAAVLGPGNKQFSHPFGLWVSRDGSAARYLIVLDVDPLGPPGVAAIQGLQTALPSLLRRCGLAGTHATVGGDSALASLLVEGTDSSLERVTPAVLGAIFIMMALYLRAIAVPLLLVFTSALATVASLGLTVYLLQDLLGWGEITYYVIFTVAVLLVSLGSDYNVFLAGRVWQAGRHRPLTEAVRTAGVQVSRPIATAGFVLALCFALLAIIPLRPFREIAFGMFTGLIIDTFIIRTLLAPALITLVARRREHAAPASSAVAGR